MLSLLDSLYFNLRAERLSSDSVASTAYIRIFAQNSRFWRPGNSILPTPSLNEAYGYVSRANLLLNVAQYHIKTFDLLHFG